MRPVYFYCAWKSTSGCNGIFLKPKLAHVINWVKGATHCLNEIHIIYVKLFQIPYIKVMGLKKFCHI